jgi:hypothetical protein
LFLPGNVFGRRSFEVGFLLRASRDPLGRKPVALS